MSEIDLDGNPGKAFGLVSGALVGFFNAFGHELAEYFLVLKV